MTMQNLALAKTDDLPIRHEGDVHSGKVRSVYWLGYDDSVRIASQKGYDLPTTELLGVMIISDKISAYECNWKGENGLLGIPGKGAALNAMSEHWFKRIERTGIGNSHLLEAPHPLVWIVQRAKPVMVEAIARQYITGSMWRAYAKGERNFCGITIPDDLEKNQKLDELLVTPTTKGIMKGIPGIPEDDDVNITRQQIMDNYKAFGFRDQSDVVAYEQMLKDGFKIIYDELAQKGEIFVDTKFEFGYAWDNTTGNTELFYIDEIGTADSSRMWNADEYKKGNVVENSKEGFRQFLLNNTNREILTDKKRMPERIELANTYRVPVEQMMEVSETYKNMAETITGQKLLEIEDPREEILDELTSYGLVR